MEIQEIINTQKSEFKKLLEREDIILETAENKSEEELILKSQVNKNIIHFYFCLDGSGVFAFGPHYSRPLEKQRNYFFYNPDMDLPFELKLAPHTRVVAFSIKLESLHKLFTHEALPFLKPENAKTKLYDEREIPTNLLVVLNQIFTVNLSESAEKLYYHGKVLEILGLYFSEKKPDTEACPS